MRTWMLLSLLAGCGGYTPASPYMLDQHVESFTPEHSDWLFRNCQLTDMDLLPPYAIPFMSYGNEALVVGNRGLVFACGKRPPWPRGDEEEVARWLPKLQADLVCERGNEPDPTVTTSEVGTGEAVTDTSFVRVRIRRTAVVLGADKQAFHGREPNTDREKQLAQTIAKGTRIPVERGELLLTSHVSCLGSLGRGLVRLRVGTQAEIVCSDGTWDVRVLGAGGERVFVEDLELNR